MPYKISFTSGSDVPESRSGDLALHAYAGFRLLPMPRKTVAHGVGSKKRSDAIGKVKPISHYAR